MPNKLSRRERQILDVLYRCRQATVAQVQAELKDPPGYDGVRTTLRSLERKGFVRHWQDGPRYLYAPAMPMEKARGAALRHLVGTFFGGSSVKAALALLSMSEDELDDAELTRIRALLGADREEDE